MSGKILITGGTGLIGKRLSKLLLYRGYEVRILSRSKRESKDYKYYQWDISKGYIEEGALNVDCIIHLAGAGVADKRWSTARKKEIIDSRTRSSELIKQELEKLSGDKPFYIGASAIGYYGNSDDLPLGEEEDSREEGFLVEVVQKWEKAHLSLAKFVSDLAILRIGIVLSPDGGALKPMLIPFLFRVGNYFGDGSQVFSWIHLDDLCRMFVFILENKLAGVFNGVAPNVVNGKELVKAIANVKKGPFLQFGAPEFALKLIFGEMSEAILMSTWASSAKIEEEGFDFKFEHLENAMQDLLS